MGKGLIIGIIITVLIIAIGIYAFYPDKNINSDCAKEGEDGPNGSLGPNDPNKDIVCCEGLTLISTGIEYDPTSEYADENGCLIMVGSGTVCSACGNGNCEDDWENKCNCPEDCS